MAAIHAGNRRRPDIGLFAAAQGPALQSAVYRTTLAVTVICPLVGAVLSAAGLVIPTLALPRIPAVVVEALPAKDLPSPTLTSSGHEQYARSIQPNPTEANDADQLPGFARSDDRRAESRLSPGSPHIAPVPPASQSSGDLQPVHVADDSPTLSNMPGRRSTWAVRAVPAITVVGVSLIWLLGSAAAQRDWCSI